MDFERDIEIGREVAGCMFSWSCRFDEDPGAMFAEAPGMRPLQRDEVLGSAVYCIRPYGHEGACRGVSLAVAIKTVTR